MTLKTTCRAALMAGLIAALAGCGNDDRRDPIYDAAYASLFGGGDEDNKPISDQEIAATLAATDLPVIRLRIEERKSEAVAFEIERNGEHRTYGTSSRQAIVLRHGMITATRGLGGDLMSVEEDALLRLVRARSAGQARYVQRFLTPEDVTEVLAYSCTVTPQQQVEVTPGVSGMAVRAACSSETEPDFADVYIVDAGGEILGARQWLGETTGYVTLQQLRR
ncbi:YjbF family lipoprotein [Salipiger pacificus]|nr:YjbF family lipoprotein [Alloyangia pacifica]MCA0945349.1 YjbF family lipoprotein [Alloyangia pacifica]